MDVGLSYTPHMIVLRTTNPQVAYFSRYHYTPNQQNREIFERNRGFIDENREFQTEDIAALFPVDVFGRHRTTWTMSSRRRHKRLTKTMKALSLLRSERRCGARCNAIFN